MSLHLTRFPEPALVRSVLVAVTGVVAYVVGHQVDTDWISTVLDLYTLFTPVVAGVAIRPVVTPTHQPTPPPSASVQ